MGIWKSSCALFRNSRSLRVASVAALLLFAVLLSAHFALSYLILSYQSKTALENFGQGITADKTYLLGQGNAIAADESFIEVASSGDPERILPVIKTEREKRNIGLMGFANEHGVILSRTLTSSSTGENAFLTSPQGRALSAGAEYIASIEISSFDPVQLLMTTGRHVYNDGKRIGALFSNRLMDDVYAANFRDSYLPYGSEVFFYTNR